MNHPSFWEGTSPKTSFPALQAEIEVDIAIIGGGITGISAAYLLSQAGKSVAVLEAWQIGLSTTGYSTGNLYATVDDNLYRIRDQWDQKTATAVAQSRSQVIDSIERTIVEFNIPCGFSRRPHYLFPTDESQIESMEQEFQTLREAGLSASIIHDVPLPFPVDQALKIENQAQFHPLIYVQKLAEAIASDRCQIFENSPVVEIQDDEKIVCTAQGKVRAAHIIVATHTPKGFNVLQTELYPYREYGIAARLSEGDYPEGIFWSLEEPSHSIRSYDAEGTPYLIVIGEKHKVGQPEEGADYYHRVEAYAQSHFKVESVDYRWSAQHYRSADHLPYIGESLSSKDVYIATGFSTNGLVYGPLGAQIITDQILNRENLWSELYSSKRFTPAKSAKEFLAETANMVQQYIRDYLTKADLEKLAEIPQGEGRLTEIDGEKVAAYRGEDDHWTVLSPVCTHLGCIVHWNELEKSWDCPCHGSRFRYDGVVLEGPAIAPLKQKAIKD